MSTKWALYLSITLFPAICLAPCEVLTVLYGAGDQGGTAPLVILSVGQLVNVGTGAVGFILVRAGRGSW